MVIFLGSSNGGTVLWSRGRPGALVRIAQLQPDRVDNLLGMTPGIVERYRRPPPRRSLEALDAFLGSLLLLNFRKGDDRPPGPHDDRLLKAHPAVVANSGRRQQAKPLAGARVNLGNRHPPPGPDALQVEPGDDPVVGKLKG